MIRAALKGFRQRYFARRGYLVSIVMPCKDPDPHFFAQALQSVLDQTDPHWKLIIVDDHSEETATQKIYADLRERKDKRITVVANQSRQISGAVNTGMRVAKTPYVCMLHADDLLDVNATQVLREHIIAYPDVDYFHSARQVIDAESQPLSAVYAPTPQFSAEDFQTGGQVKHLHCWRVTAGLAVGGVDESLGPHGADDYDFPWCMAEAGFNFHAIDKCLYYYRDHRNHPRLTTHVPLDRQLLELKKIFKKHNMDDQHIADELQRRKNGYLQQALFHSEEDKQHKEATGFDPHTGWHEPYKQES